VLARDERDVVDLGHAEQLTAHRFPRPLGDVEVDVGRQRVAVATRDWLFPTYRDSVAVLTRGVPAEQTLTLLRGDWHCGYDPYEHRVAPQCTPLATNTLHAVGLAYAARLKEQDQVALVLLGDGATSEGDTHEALNFAAVWKAPVVFLVQNNGYAISVPLAKQTAAPTLAAKGIGYGVPSLLIDGNDAAAVYAAVRAGVERGTALPGTFHVAGAVSNHSAVPGSFLGYCRGAVPRLSSGGLGPRSAVARSPNRSRTVNKSRIRHGSDRRPE
jgi:hypothetical protein